MKQTTKNRLLILLSMLVISILFILLFSNINFNEYYKTLMFDYNSESYPYTVQNIMWLFFFFGVGEIFYRYLFVIKNSGYLKHKILPEDDNRILQISDMGKIYRETKRHSDESNNLYSIIKKLAMQFQTTNSISQTHEMLNSQIQMLSDRLDTKYNMIRYIVWLIPTLGFIGTVIGIANALEFAGVADPNSAQFLKELTVKLGVAFYTTLVALIMSTILVFFMNIVQAKEEESVIDIGQYCLDNFINKLYSKGEVNGDG